MVKKNKIIILILIILLICGLSTYIFLTPSTMENNGSINITDMANRSVQIPTSVDNVVATSPSMTTVLYMIAPDKLSGLNFAWNEYEEKYVPSQYKDLPVVGGWFGSKTGNYEEFIALEPDVIIDSIDEGDSNVDTVNEHQTKFGEIPVVAVKDSTRLEHMSDSIIFTGEIVGSQETAKKLADFNDMYLSTVESKVSSISNQKTVYFAEGKDGLQTVPSSAPQSQQINLVGAKNVADGIDQGNSSSGFQVSVEQVISWNPDVIITTNPDFYKMVKNDSKWSEISAVKNGEVYLSPQSPFKWFGRPVGVNLIIGLPWVAKVVYPDEYSDINMVNATQEFYTNFYHTDLSNEEAKQILLDSGLKEKNL